MSLSKIPVIIAVSVGFRTVVTPPHPPPPKDELVTTTRVDHARFNAYRHTLATVNISSHFTDVARY